MQSNEKLDKTKLLDFLGIVEKELEREITLIAAGGTAMTLLDIKPSTHDIDFTGPGDDIRLFKLLLKRIPHGYKIDCWPDGIIFSQILPEDYLEKSIFTTGIKRIELRALHPRDIVVTKIGRLDDKDLEDIRDCIQKYALTEKEIVERAKQVEYVGNQAYYDANLDVILNQFFRK